MNDFNVRIIEDNGDIHIYTNAERVSVDEDMIRVEYEDGDVDHYPSDVDEIIIKPNR